MAAKLNPSELYSIGQKVRDTSNKVREKDKVGTLRAGTTGMIDEKGNIIGVCAARAYLRMVGVDISEVDNVEEIGDRELMFEAGRSNEDIWTENLKLAGIEVLREEEIPTSWLTTGGIPVTGRPDIVLLSEVDGISKPVLGLELKLVSSLWKAKNYRFDGKPSLEHLLQAGHYSWQLGIPFEIHYTNRAQFAVMGADWITRMFPKYGEPGSEDCTYTYYRHFTDEKGGIKQAKTTVDEWKSDSDEVIIGKRWNSFEKRMEEVTVPRYKAEIKAVLPFRVGYRIEWTSDGKLKYARIDRETGEFGELMDTIITLDRLQNFYSYISDLRSNGGKVPNPPQSLDLGGAKLGFKVEDYCSLLPSGMCCKVNKGRDINVWTKELEDKKSTKSRSQ